MHLQPHLDTLPSTVSGAGARVGWQLGWGLGRLLGQEPEHFSSMPPDSSVSKWTVCITHVDFVTLCVCVSGGEGGHWFWFSCHIQHPLSHVLWPRQRGGGDATYVQPKGPAHPLCAPGSAACSHSHCASCVIPCAWGPRGAMEQRDMGRGYRHRCLDGCWR